MPRYPILCFLCVLLATPVAYAANVRLQVEGLSGDLERNVRARLSTIGTDEVTSDGRFRSRVDEAIRQGLRALGYYDPTITFDLQPRPAPARSVLIAKVVPGEPVLIAGVDIVLQGGAKTDPDYLSLVRRDTPKIGSVLNHGDFDNFKSSLTGLALRRGYFDANMIKSQLGVAAELRKAFWDIDFDSGERYRFGNVVFQGSQIREDFLQNLVPFHEGDFYTSDELAELNRRLAATNWFNSVVVSPDFRDARKTKVLPLDAVVTPRTENTVELGGGYATDVGPRLTASWRKPWMNSYGHSLTTSTTLSAPEKTLDFSYRIPLLKNPLEQYYLLQGGFKRTDLNDTKSDTTTLNVARFWDLSSGWKRSVNLRWSLDHFTQGSVTDTTMLLYPGVNISRTRQRGGAMPVWGDSQNYSIDVSDTTWGSDVDFAILQAQNVWIRTLGEKNRFVVRGNLGWIETNDFDRVPPSLRFFTGGDQTVRGYGYETISPRGSDGKLLGGRYVSVASAEYNYRFSDKWLGALFVDGGTATVDYSEAWKIGTGVGVRWVTPIGQVRLDLAVGISEEDKPLRLHFALGPEL